MKEMQMETAKKTKSVYRFNSQKVKKVLGNIVIFIFLLGLAYEVLFPFLTKLSTSFMSKSDLYDSTVSLVPKALALDNYSAFFKVDRFAAGYSNTLIYAVIVAVCAVFCSTCVGYGLARYRFKGCNILFGLVILTLLIPSITISVPLYSTFRFFDLGSIFQFITGSPLTLTNSPVPFLLLSITGLSFRGGVFIILMRQYYKGIPNELIEAAYIDGAGHFKTFFSVALPMARSMMIVIFVLAFAWQWTDTLYSGILLGNTPIMPNIIQQVGNVPHESSLQYYFSVLANTGVLILLIPLLLIYILFQRKIVEGIERSGIVG